MSFIEIIASPAILKPASTTRRDTHHRNLQHRSIHLPHHSAQLQLKQH